MIGHSPSHTLDVGIVWLSAPVSAQKNLPGLHGDWDVVAFASAAAPIGPDSVGVECKIKKKGDNVLVY